MSTKLKFHPGIVLSLILIITTVIVFIMIANGVTDSFPYHIDIRVYGVLSLCCIFVALRSYEFTKEGLYIRYLFVIKRHIKKERIVGIRLEMERGNPFLVVFIDDCHPVKSRGLALRSLFSMRQVIHIRVFAFKCEKYIEPLSAMFPNVAKGESYLEWQRQQVRKEIFKR